MILLAGFGPFVGVPENPSSALARALDGQRIREIPIRGIEIPVSYARGPEATIAAAREGGASLVLGIGVATSRTRPEVERWGRDRITQELPDVDGQIPAALGGPERVSSTLDVVRLAVGIGARVSTDAGSYVCNAWLHRVARALPQIPVGFLHVPPAGLAPGRLRAGLERLIESR